MTQETGNAASVNLIKKIARAIIAVGAVSEDGKSSGAGERSYSYITSKTVLAVAGKALADEGVVVVPEVIRSTVETLTVKTSRGEATRYDASLDFLMTVTDGEDVKTFGWTGMGVDYQSPDKAVYKAMTSGHKYFLAKLLNLSPFGETEDSEHEAAEGGTVQKTEKNTSGKTKTVPASTFKPNPDAVSDAIVEATVNSEGVKYTEIEDNKLKYMSNSLQKSLATAKSTTIEERAEKELKINVIARILRDRATK